MFVLQFTHLVILTGDINNEYKYLVTYWTDKNLVFVGVSNSLPMNIIESMKLKLNVEGPT